MMERTGEVLVAASLAQEYGFTDIDGKIPRPLTLSEVIANSYSRTRHETNQPKTHA